MLRGNFTTLSTSVTEEERSKISTWSFHIKKLEKEQNENNYMKQEIMQVRANANESKKRKTQKHQLIQNLFSGWNSLM